MTDEEFDRLRERLSVAMQLKDKLTRTVAKRDEVLKVKSISSVRLYGPGLDLPIPLDGEVETAQVTAFLATFLQDQVDELNKQLEAL